jgi:FecR protein
MRAELGAVLLLILILGLAALGYRIFFVDPIPGVVLQRVEGEVRTHSADGSRASAAGERLQVQDRVISGAGGRAVLSIGGGSELSLAEKSTIQLLSVDAEGVHIALEGGRVDATVRPGSRRLDVTAAGQEFSTTDGDFSAAVDEEGNLAVRSSRGSLNARDRVLSAGERLTPDGSATENLLLTVDWPPARSNAARVWVQGRTEPGARVEITGPSGPLKTTAGKDGSYKVELVLVEGENKLVVEATSLLGEVVRSESSLVRDTTAPTIRVQISDQHP